MKRLIMIGILILAVSGLLYVAIRESAKIATFEECVKAGWLVRDIKVYDGFGPIEAKCTLWSGKSFTKQKSEKAQSNWETKTDDRLPVTITVTPIELGKNAKIWKFQITIDTHSGSLDDDLLTVVSMVDNTGSTYRPTAWEGPGPGGHHREGVLQFTSLSPAPPAITLKISDVGGITERTFTWEIK